MGILCISDSTYDTHVQQAHFDCRNDGLGLFACISKQPVNEVPSEVVAKMAAQEAAWNAGDISAFMDIAYWNDDALLFVGSNTNLWL